MFKLKKLSKQQLIFWFSLTAFLVSIIGLRFLHSPPKITNIFGEAKPGTMSFIYPDRVLVNQTFKVQIEIDTAKQDVNVVGMYLQYEPSRLRLVDMDTTASFCQFYPEKKYDNRLGTISLVCGTPHPGVSGKNILMNLEFVPLAVGTTNILTKPESQILLSNGKATNILTEFTHAKINVLSGI